jgi:hypothetical protein
VGSEGKERAGALARRWLDIKRFIVTIEGAGWTDVEDVELPSLPSQGEPVETKYGTCIVTRAEPQRDAEYEGKIDCRLP